MLRSNLLRKLDMQDLLVFIYLYELNSVTQVAEELCVSQSTVSYCLKKLRTCFADELFFSTRQGMPPSDRAVAIYPRVISILQAVNQCCPAPACTQKGFSISAPEYFELTLLPVLFKAFHTRGHAVSLAMQKPGHDLPIDALKSGSTDLAFCFGPNLHRGHPCVRVQPVLEDDLVCLLDSATAPIGRRMALAEFSERRHVCATPWAQSTDIIDTWLSRQGFNRDITAKASSYGAAVSLLRGTSLVLALPRQVAGHFSSHPWLHCCEGPEGLPSFTLNMAWSDRLDRDADNAWLREEVLQAAKGLQPRAKTQCAAALAGR